MATGQMNRRKRNATTEIAPVPRSGNASDKRRDARGQKPHTQRQPTPAPTPAPTTPASKPKTPGTAADLKYLNPANSLTGESGPKAGKITYARDVQSTAQQPLGNTEKNYAGRTALEEFGEANRIRQQTIDDNSYANSRGGNITIVGGESEGSAFDKKRMGLIDDLGRGGHGGKRDFQANYRALQAMDSLGAERVSRLNSQDRLAGTQYAVDSGAYNDDIVNAQRDNKLRIDQQKANALDTAANARAQAAARKPIVEGMSDFRSDLAAAVETGTQAQVLDIYSATFGDAPEFQNALDALPDEFFIDQNFEGGLIESYAGGGMVPQGPQAGPALGAVTPQQPDNGAMHRYQQYAASAQEMGLNVIPFERFASLQQPVEAFAGGGEVPDAAGKMVVDPDPNAPIDSIPAEIDGERPAALNSGEFIFPTDVVLFWGTDKLKKMIDKARESDEAPNGDTGQQQTALGLGAGQ